MAKKSILNKKSISFLEKYLNNAAPTGYEWEGQKIWMDYLKPYVDEFITDIHLSGIIYVKTNPTICQERIILRNRVGETIPLDYSINCHKYHEEWLTSSNTPILTLDGNIHYQEAIPKEWDEQIVNFIHKYKFKSAKTHHTFPPNNSRERLSKTNY